MGASPDIIFTSSPDFFIIFFILANGSEWRPVLPVILPLCIPEYAPACLILLMEKGGLRWNFMEKEAQGVKSFKENHKQGKG